VITRRGFLVSMLALGAAPAIVRASSLMPVNARVSDWALLMAALNRGELHTVPVREYEIDRSLEITRGGMTVSLPPGAVVRGPAHIDVFCLRAGVQSVMVADFVFAWQNAATSPDSKWSLTGGDR